MKKYLIILLFLLSNVFYAQQDLTRFAELQRIFFVAEASGLASATYNPAAICMRTDNNGIVLGYDFNEFKQQGNSSAFFTMNNFGIAYQDIYNINDVRLQNYSVNLSIGNEYFAIGTTNRLMRALYPGKDVDKFSLDAGIIIKPAPFISLGMLARNLSQISFDSLNYARTYTAGVGLIFFDEQLSLYGDVDFQDNTKIDNVSGTLGLVIAPLDLFEFRGGVILNPADITELREGKPKVIDLKYASFVTASFLIEKSIRLTAGASFNSAGERTRYSVIIGFPLSNTRY
jgi:hypothetical protein